MVRLISKSSPNKKISFKTPAQLNFSMPAEWEKHEATWLAWPHNPITWPGKRMPIVEDIYVQMMEALLPNEKVHLLVENQKEEDKVVGLLRKRKINLKNFIPHQIFAVDSWIRDYGPTFLKNDKNQKAWCKWIFNAWGGKYLDLAEDTKIFDQFASQLIPHSQFKLNIVLEGGSIEVNGSGTCLTTEQCLLHKNRNPKLTKKQIETYLKNYLGVSQVIWLKDGIEGDDTDGHVDDITRFVNPTTIISAFEDNAKHKNHKALAENWAILEQSTSESGKKWNLVKFPMPKKIRDGGVLPASYANFYIANRVVLLPVYGDKTNDKRAASILKELMPKREVVSILCPALVYGLGSIHCVTQQEPA